jgi:hypothetical protein
LLVVEEMALTRNFKQTLMDRIRRDPAFAKALRKEAAELLRGGERKIARSILRDLSRAAQHSPIG